MHKNAFYIVILLLILVGCNQQEERTPIAQVHDEILYLDEVDLVIPNELGEADSTLWADDFIKNWVRRKLLIWAAEQNLNADQKNVEKELEEYRNSLITYRYKKELMAQKMDTIVSDREAEQYYQQHEQQFILSKNIVKAIYLKTPLEVSDPETIKNLSTDESPEKLAELDDYGIRYAKTYDRFNDKWIEMENILNQIPSDIPDQERFLRRNKFVESDDTDYYYFICIRDFRLAGEPAPLEYVESQIKNLLLNQRKVKFLKQVEDDIYKEGTVSNKYKIFNVQK
ncbi:hypothetical protein ACUNWD_02745 [Sunxiuqinia sp. A32]|uniref:hypothetical protein n=1 Tax=Sunxiuqinia sp. A32 TaxID=3461496 RepID=UPI0040464237